MQNVTKIYNLSSPKMCRDFLKDLRIGEAGNKITELTQADGKAVSIDDATDEAVLNLVNEITNSMNLKKKEN